MDDDPNLILVIRGIPGAPAEALELPHNRGRYRAPPGHSQESPPDPRNRTTAPNSESDEDDPGNNSYVPAPGGSLLLTFDKPPADITRGFTFGVSKKRCDVLLAKTRAADISAMHFVITFDKAGHLVLRDVSSRETAVSYDGWGEKHQRRGFQWILDLNAKRMSISVHLRNGFRLDLTLPRHDSCQSQYRANVVAYVEASQNSVLGLGGLNMPSRDPTRPLSPINDPIYFPVRFIGGGAFGKVYKVLDVSTGRAYASKILLFHSADMEKMEKKLPESPAFEQHTTELREFSNEMKIMKSLVHKHVVEFVCSAEDPLQIVMEYMPLGSLRHQHRSTPISTSEIQLVLAQGLDALRFMHSKGVTHRDIKPENILVYSRNGGFIIKIADFGISKLGSVRTNIGTRSYKAPEFFHPPPINYDNRVDIWALGVVALEFTYGAPDVYSGDDTQLVADAAQRALISHPDSPFYFMVSRMLEINPNNRPTAEDCFEGEPTIDFSRKFSGETSGLTTPTNNRSLSAQTSRASASPDSTRRLPTGNMQAPISKRNLSSTSSRSNRNKRQRHLMDNASLSQTRNDRTVTNAATGVAAPFDVGNRRRLEHSYQYADAPDGGDGGGFDRRQRDTDDGRVPSGTRSSTSKSGKQKEPRHDLSAGADKPLSSRSRNSIARNLTSLDQLQRTKPGSRAN
ncbi:serine/threonine protein kinase [Blastomyces parvus]|uniref:Serine/threonine protein kinase n=1 Tax=Blastomyces parvus TaxID=2060905 RepID=A0A2B7XBY9_9EURO|nr:serine/threonine protein kinase [Blastomyces parvus]